MVSMDWALIVIEWGTFHLAITEKTVALLLVLIPVMFIWQFPTAIDAMRKLLELFGKGQAKSLQARMDAIRLEQIVKASGKR